MPRVPLVIKPAARPGAVNPRVPVNIRPAPARRVPTRPPVRPVPVSPVPVSPVPVNPGGSVVTRVTLPLHESTRIKHIIDPTDYKGGYESRLSSAQQKKLKLEKGSGWQERLAAQNAWRPPTPTAEDESMIRELNRVEEGLKSGAFGNGGHNQLPIPMLAAFGIGVWWVPSPFEVTLGAQVVSSSGILKSDLASFLDPVSIPPMPDGSAWRRDGGNVAPSNSVSGEAWGLAWQAGSRISEEAGTMRACFHRFPDIICPPGGDSFKAFMEVMGVMVAALKESARLVYPESKGFVLGVICPHPHVTQEWVRSGLESLTYD